MGANVFQRELSLEKHWVHILEVQLDIWTKVVQTASLTNLHSRMQDMQKIDPPSHKIIFAASS